LTCHSLLQIPLSIYITHYIDIPFVLVGSRWPQLYTTLVKAQVPPQSVAAVLSGLPDFPTSPTQVFFLGLSLEAAEVLGDEGTGDGHVGGGAQEESGRACCEADGGGGGGAWISKNTYWVTRYQLTDEGVQLHDEYAELSAWRASGLPALPGLF
jgi:hypothetical protein